MKALKEKRVSLRSLFRRSLVILSLLALAFAVGACSESNDPDPGTEPPPVVEPPPPVEPPRYVTGMTVLSHPNWPSYEGAKPDLTGLKVLVFFSDGKQETVTDTAKFAVYPPVAKVTTVAEPKKLSKLMDYTIQYIGEDMILAGGYKANVYIPAVIPLATATIAGARIPAAQKILSAYEDDEVLEVGNLTFSGTYIADSGLTFDTIGTVLSTLPNDYVGGPVWQEAALPVAWTAAGVILGGEKSKAVSGSRDAWKIEKNNTGSGATATYLASMGSPDASDLADSTVDITTFYKITSFEYVSGIEKVKAIAADGKLNDATAWDAADDVSKQAWLDALFAARDDLKFKVYYYVLAGDETADKDRPLTMAQYYRAAFTVNPDTGFPKATMPVLLGNPEVYVPGTPATHSTPLQYVLADDWELYLCLTYYNILITGKIGKGELDFAALTTEDAEPEEYLYTYPNTAIIPIGDRVLRFNTVEKVPKTNGSYNQTPEISNSKTDDDVRLASLKAALIAEWKVNYVYGEGEDAIRFEVNPNVWTHDDNFSVEFEDVDEGVITRQIREGGVEVTIPAPASADEGGDLTFDYYQLP